MSLNRLAFENALYALEGRSYARFRSELGLFLSAYAQQADTIQLKDRLEEDASVWRITVVEANYDYHQFSFRLESLYQGMQARLHLAVPAGNVRLAGLVYNAVKIFDMGFRPGVDGALQDHIVLSSPACVTFDQIDRQKLALVLMAVTTQLKEPESQDTNVVSFKPAPRPG